MISRKALATLLVAAAYAPASAFALAASARPAWDGWLRADQPTEVTIRVTSEAGGQLRLALADRSVVYHHTTVLAPDTGFTWRLPLSPPSGQPLRLDVQLGEQETVATEIPLRRYQAPLPLVAVLSGNPIVVQSDRVTTIHVASNAAPYHASSYGAIDILVIHRDSLQGLARQQLLALRGHAANCGRMVVVGFTPAAVASFLELAGCHGRYLVAASTAQLDGALEALITARPMPLPSPGSLRTLFENDKRNRSVQPIAWLLALYLLVLLMALLSRSPARNFVGASLVASLLAWVTWSLSPAIAERVSWAETDSHADLARVVSLLRVRGNGGAVTLEVPGNTGPLQPLQATDLRVDSGAGEGGASRISFDARLLSNHEFFASGVSAWLAPVSVEWHEARPRIFNHGPKTSPPGLLAWDDRKYSVPALEPGEDWRPTANPEPWEAGGAEQIFRHRAMQEALALLFEKPGQSGFSADAASVYLMVRP